jgi:outer membrane protein OmpA-like peptidoglycan-associated protein
MDKVKAEAAAKLQNANVDQVTDANGLPCVKVTFNSGILFGSGNATLSSTAATELTNFAAVLKNNTDCSVAIQGYTDNDPWKGSTAEQSAQKNLKLSQQRADAVKSKLNSLGITNNQIKSSTGYGEANPVADNSSSAGKAQNRRVEVYLYASEAMINAANEGKLQ